MSDLSGLCVIHSSGPGAVLYNLAGSTAAAHCSQILNNHSSATDTSTIVSFALIHIFTGCGVFQTATHTRTHNVRIYPVLKRLSNQSMDRNLIDKYFKGELHLFQTLTSVHQSRGIPLGQKQLNKGFCGSRQNNRMPCHLNQGFLMESLCYKQGA